MSDEDKDAGAATEAGAKPADATSAEAKSAEPKSAKTEPEETEPEKTEPKETEAAPKADAPVDAEAAPAARTGADAETVGEAQSSGAEAKPEREAKPAAQPKKAGAKPAGKRLNLALQGGGAHGAFTWGVLERLLDEEDIEIEGVSATSAGAMNGAMLTSGLKAGGRKEAKARLEAFWREIIETNPLNQPPWSYWLSGLPMELSPEHLAKRLGVEFNPLYMMSDLATRMVSPYQFNPGNINPLRKALESIIDFSKVRRSDPPRLYVCATDVRSGRAKIFGGEEITLDALLASACLPSLFQAVVIDGREYWDGGFTGNPAIWPLIYQCASPDVMIVHVNPIVRDEAPRNARAIENRVNEISFNSNLMGEMRAIAHVNRLLDEGSLDATRYKRMRIHAVEDGETMRRLTVATKVTPDWRLIQTLREAGAAVMEAWLSEHKDRIGVESSVDIREAYL